MKINILIINILAVMFVVLIFIMAFTFIIFHFQDSSTSLKDAWSTIGSIFGGIATLTAAYIASKLFNDWRDIENFKREIEVLDKTYFMISNIHKKLLELKIISSKTNTNLDEKKEGARAIRDLLHQALTYIALDPLKSKKSNQDIQAYFNILNTLLENFREYMPILIQDSKLQPVDFTKSNTQLNKALNELNKSLDLMIKNKDD